MNLPKKANSVFDSNKAITVNLIRGCSIESTHKVHAAVTDEKGRLLMSSGNKEHETFIRSALKPFQALPFINSGACDFTNKGDRCIAIACGSHIGSPIHAREAYKILWNSEIDISKLKCPTPLNKKSALEHNCSGKHAAFLSTCKKMGWPIESYLEGSHPLQKEIIRKVAELLEIPRQELVAERDDCGAPTLYLEIRQIAKLFAKLGSSQLPEFEKITRAMIKYPELIGGEGRFDTELIQRSHGQLISKGGAEGIQCLTHLGERMGVAIKVEDGSKRAKHAVALHLLKQLDWVTPSGLQELEEKILIFSPGVQLEVDGQLKFKET